MHDAQYRSYLLRLWQERLASPAVWRASLEDPQTGERFGFSGMDQLFAFLQARMLADPPELAAEHDPGKQYGSTTSTTEVQDNDTHKRKTDQHD